MLRGEEYNPNNFEDMSQSQYNKYKRDNEDYFVDNFEGDKKRQNQNYSNLFGQKLGDPELKSQYSKVHDQKNTLELNVNERENSRSNGYGYKGDMVPSVHYSEYRNANKPVESRRDPNQNQLMEEKTQRMMASLRKETEPQQYRNEEEYVEDNQSRNYYKKMMGVGKNIINNTENNKMFDYNPNEHLGEVIVRDYRVQGYKYDLLKTSDKQLRGELLKEGFHVVTLKIVQDPISGDPNGLINIRVRLQKEKEGRFEQYIQQYMNWVILGKK